ncbi:hypothetical protein [Paenibacillus tianmuensis]|uniref:hypothetical protein n=1 Tax=Paenibacillus tianmuensis TaxID=624147 RepID=UPI001431D3E5|nr:hypothetical protein [Paenibacillus tianmuensis]
MLMDKFYQVEYEYSESDDSDDQDVRTDKETVEAFSESDARHQVIVRAIEPTIR